MLIRRETSDDHAAIAKVHRDAFADLRSRDVSQVGEVGLVAALRDSDAWLPGLALVAEFAGHVVGHVCLTRAQVRTPVGDVVPVLALGPIGVLTAQQGNGVGSALIHAALGGADALGEQLVALVGHADYYPNFGFQSGAQVGIVPDLDDWAEDFQVRMLDAYAGLVGVFRYASPFYVFGLRRVSEDQ